MTHHFRILARCPVPELIAPYIRIVTHEANATINSIYRGTDAQALLNKYGKESQAQLYSAWVRRQPGANPANSPGFSTHEQKSDGVAYPGVPRGGDLPWWGVGFDVDDSDVVHVIAAAQRHGWHLFRPYSSGSEYHHLNFKYEPHPHTLADKVRIAWLRRVMPRS